MGRDTQYVPYCWCASDLNKFYFFPQNPWSAVYW
jgi:hypothetical protein